jgi:mannose-6-phosphate isomerase-like protein (cupin superfamily)
MLVRSGFTRKFDDTDEPVTVQTMFSTEVVRSSDSDGRLAVYVFPVGEHHAYRGAPLHLHHEQDEWIHVLGGEFVAEVGGERMRLKPGDSLLMPMKVPHRWSVAQDPHCGAGSALWRNSSLHTRWINGNTMSVGCTKRRSKESGSS